MDQGPSGYRALAAVVVSGLTVVAGYLALGATGNHPAIGSEPSAPLLDPSFGDVGSPGVVRLDPSSGYRTIARAVQLPGGFAVLNVAATDVNGLPTEPFGLARLDPDGQLDTSFGDPATPGFVSSVEASAMAVDGEGRVLVGDSGSIRRYTASGAVDTSFVRHFPPDPANPPPPSTPGRVDVRGEVERILVSTDGAIIVAASGHPSDGYSTVTKLLTDGDYDPTFGAGDDPGYVALPFTPIVGPVELADGRLGVVPRGRAIPFGVTPTTPSRALMYVITSEGTLDTAVGGGSGVVELGPPGIAVVDLVRSGDRLLLDGWPDSAPNGVVVATDLAGSLDPTWGDGGRLELAALGQRSATLIRWPDRPEVGLQFWGGDASTMLVRLSSDGSLDASFGADPLNPGWLVLELPTPPGTGHWLTFDGVEGGAVMGTGRSGYPPTGGVWSHAEAVRTRRFGDAPNPAPIRPYEPPPSVATTTTTVPSSGTTTSSSVPVATVPPRGIDGAADVRKGAVRILP